MTAVLLVGAILSEVGGTLALRTRATTGDRRWLLAVVVGYLAAFSLLAVTLDRGLAVGVAYGIWAAAGIATTAVASRVLFDDPLTRRMLAGIALIIVGVLLVELGAEH